jgi:hypothetical protein
MKFSSLLQSLFCVLCPTLCHCDSLMAQQPASGPRPPALREPTLPQPSSSQPQSSPETNLLLGEPPVDQLPKPLAGRANAAMPSPATSVTLNLLKLMVAKGLLGADEAQALITQAEAEAELAKTQLLEDAELRQAAEDEVRVAYVPENVKQELREEIRNEVLDKAKAEQWLKVPEEESERYQVYGDVRMRARADLLAGQGNDNTGAFPNFNQINNGHPYDLRGLNYAPQQNVDQDRYRFQLRARVGIEAALSEGWFMGGGLATGDNSSPVTQNQTLGGAAGQGGNFSKFSIWLDRAYMRYEVGNALEDQFQLFAGRHANPFLSTEMMWDNDLGFDGLSLKGRRRVGDAVVFGSAGAFPIYNTDLNFGTNQPAKFESRDRYLLGAQLGMQLPIADKVSAKLSAAYHEFINMEGLLSSPMVPLSDQDIGDTDHTRPTFAQRGNTYRALRDIRPDPANGNGTTNQFQYFGLASAFRNLDLYGSLDVDLWEPYRLSFIANYVQNLAWDQDQINSTAINNRGPSPSDAVLGDYEGGNKAFMLRSEFGKPKFERRGDWQVFLDFRHVQSDAMPDAFTDSVFGGGTNFSGFSIGGAIGLSPHVKLGARWASISELSGPPLSQDLLLFDLTAKF